MASYHIQLAFKFNMMRRHSNTTKVRLFLQTHRIMIYIGYADLSDFFFVWMKRSLQTIFPDIFGILATPKSEELVATPYRHGTKEKSRSIFSGWYEKKRLCKWLTSPRIQCLSCIYYAFKQSEISDAGTASKGLGNIPSSSN